LIDELQVDHVEILIFVDNEVLNAQKLRDIHHSGGSGVCALSNDLARQHTDRPVVPQPQGLGDH